MMRADLIDVTCTIVGETDRAYKIDDGTRQEWVPKSQVEIGLDGKGISGEDILACTMPTWLAKEKGFI